jgi:hypothetical protein
MKHALNGLLKSLVCLIHFQDIEIKHIYLPFSVVILKLVWHRNCYYVPFTAANSNKGHSSGDNSHISLVSKLRKQMLCIHILFPHWMKSITRKDRYQTYIHKCTNLWHYNSMPNKQVKHCPNFLKLQKKNMWAI